jgi:hypothetical protein
VYAELTAATRAGGRNHDGLGEHDVHEVTTNTNLISAGRIGRAARASVRVFVCVVSS